LKSRNLIEVSRDTSDGRKVIMSLLPAGEALLCKTIPRAVKTSEQMMGRLNEAERVALLYLLRKIGEDEEPSGL
jgi:DNA-binding MarR family transcriptional regulator